MKQSNRIWIAATTIALLAGCTNHVPAEPIPQPVKLVETPVAEPVTERPYTTDTEPSNKTSMERFSYLEQLPQDKQAVVDRFRLYSEIEPLQAFTPEEMVLVYLYLTSIGDPDAWKLDLYGYLTNLNNRASAEES
ncbi:hypothetical protein FHS18_002127 [Paenibacillus phyllosphaerae]|uniref:Uncharacterized protein n=1 Tax=Paenibacillus phyllosphaerae TaxID=274593 RepID=A0A7W5AWG7_9BACL|nr:hypothetical protein [Paenibacillus phyllosphaerae]MBB3110060.1 hypothetical protein [Paenibacillus phyllosphaerae]